MHRTRPDLRVALGALLLAASLAGGPPALGEDSAGIAALEQQAREHLVAGNYGAADEAIRAAIVSYGNEGFNRLALMQALIAAHMGGDGRSLLGAATAAHASDAWPRPVIAYLLGEQKLQQVADGIRRSGDSITVKREQVCELSLYAGAFAALDQQPSFALKLLQKANTVCDRDSPERPLLNAELAALRAQ